MGRLSLWVLLGLVLFALSTHDGQVSADVGPTESECRPYIEKAIHDLKGGEPTDSGEDGQEKATIGEDTGGGEVGSTEDTADGTESAEKEGDTEEENDTAEDAVVETVEETIEQSDEEGDDKPTEDDGENSEETTGEQETQEKSEEGAQSQEDDDADDDHKDAEGADDATKSEEEETAQQEDDETKSEEEKGDEEASDETGKSGENDDEQDAVEDKSPEQEEEDNEDSGEGTDDKMPAESVEEKDEDGPSEEEEQTAEEIAESQEEQESKANEEDDDDNEDEDKTTEKDDHDEDETNEETDEVKSRGKRSVEDEEDDSAEIKKTATEVAESAEEEQEQDASEDKEEDESKEGDDTKDGDDDDDEDKSQEPAVKEEDEGDEEGSTEEGSRPEDDLLMEVEIPENLRDRKHIDELLHLDDEFEESEKAIDRVAEIILRDIKRIYENAIKPLETLYKYRDLSNRHFGDPEIFSKPLILFMGPWSGGKSTIINYLTDNEYTPNALRSGAEPSPAYFNIVMWGNETEILDGTQLAADWTFSGLQKFGQGLEDRLRGLKLPNKLLEKVNIVEIPGILEVRKQVSRLFPFNDACQWFIDRADIIFLVYDPAKLDVGPETEAILDQLKGREYQTRIILNKADIVKPEELLRVQSALIWNISPLMSSAQPPMMYTTSLWSHPYETSSPIRLLQAQERAFLRDLRGAIDKRIENKIASARRFAVRVRNHAKMVDCYLTTYYNHKTLFGNKKRISDEIIQNPQNYHIYEGLSTLTNISRYDLPDPEVYRDFFRLNPLYEFKKLSETCTYFRGCPINKLDVAIAYDLPELVGKYKKMTESALASIDAAENSKS